MRFADGIAKLPTVGRKGAYRLKIWSGDQLYSGTFRTRGDAEAARDAIRARTRSQRLGLPDPTPTTVISVGRAFDRYLHELEHVRRRSPKYLEQVRYVRKLWCEALGESHPAALTRSDISSFIEWAWRETRSKGRAIDTALVIVRSVLRFEGFAVPTFARPDVPSRAPKTMTLDQMSRFFDALPLGSVTRTFAEIALQLAMRESEVRRLRIGDVDLERLTLVIRRGKGRSGRRGSEERLPIPPSLVDVLRAYMETLPPVETDATREAKRLAEPLLAVAVNGVRVGLEVQTLRAVVVRACKTAGVPRRDGFGWLRAQAATVSRDVGARLSDVSSALGHADPRTTLGHYDESRRADLERWMVRLAMADQIDVARREQR